MLATSGRLLSLLSLLQSRRDWPGAVLAERMQVSPRTVRRDVDRLRELGYAVTAVKGPDGGYRLDPGSDLPPLLFDDDQAVALAIALQGAALGGAGLEEGAARALQTVRQVMPSRLRHRLDAFSATAVRPPTDRAEPPARPEVLMTLSAAVHAREVLRFDYAGGHGRQGLARRAEPHHLVSWGGRWYLVAWDLDRGDWRTFRADRLTPRVPNGPRFTRRELPGGDVATFVAGRFRGSAEGTAAWPCEGEVVLALPAAQVVPHSPDALVEPVGDGRCRVVQGSWSWTSLAASFGRFDADVEVVGPPQLAEAFARLAHRYAAAGGTHRDPAHHPGGGAGTTPGRGA